jgi:uncharacterized protein (DUF885 family)
MARLYCDRAVMVARDRKPDPLYKGGMQTCRLSLCVFAAVAAACGGTSDRATAPVQAGAAKASAPGIELAFEDAGLRALIDEYWAWRLENAPVFATTVGERRFDDRLGTVAHGELLAEQRERRAFLDRARLLSGGALAPGDALTLALLIEQLEGVIGTEVCEMHLWAVSAHSNPVTEYNTLPQQHRITSAADAQSLIARYRLIPRAIDDRAANLRRGLELGKVANAESVRRVIALVDGQLATPLTDWALLEPARAQGLPGLQGEDYQRFAGELQTVVEQFIVPALQRYRDVLATDVLPRAREGATVGVGSLPDGKACYRALIRRHIGFDRSPEELHRLGMSEIASINAEMVALGQKLFGEAELAAIVNRLRTDPELYFETSDEVMAAARQALDAARARTPEYFGILPEADCVVTAIPAYEAPYTTIAYYQPAHADGSKPGEYFINTHAPETRPRFEMQVLAYHEAIPGHHLQIAIAQERGKLPPFQRHDGNTAFVEGWALYTERLADEMGLYSADLDRMGMLSYDAWRASRLVVDTGIHAMGWTRERAEQFMRDHTALTETNIRNEVDRYITWPGQAVAYKVGQLEIRRMRQEAEAALGKAFDIEAFHDAVLRNGAVTLPVLDRVVKAWAASVTR